MDPNQWDQETRGYAAFGDLHSMIDDHVNTYGTLPDQQTMDGFMSQIYDKWGAKPAQDGGNPTQQAATGIQTGTAATTQTAADTSSMSDAINDVRNDMGLGTDSKSSITAPLPPPPPGPNWTSRIDENGNTSYQADLPPASGLGTPPLPSKRRSQRFRNLCQNTVGTGAKD